MGFAFVEAVHRLHEPVRSAFAWNSSYDDLSGFHEGDKAEDVEKGFYEQILAFKSVFEDGDLLEEQAVVRCHEFGVQFGSDFDQAATAIVSGWQSRCDHSLSENSVASGNESVKEVIHKEFSMQWILLGAVVLFALVAVAILLTDAMRKEEMAESQARADEAALRIAQQAEEARIARVRNLEAENQARGSSRPFKHLFTVTLLSGQRSRPLGAFRKTESAAGGNQTAICGL